MIVITGCESEDDEGVDLVVTNITASPDVEAGTTTSVACTIRNTGKEDALGAEQKIGYYYYYTGFRVGIYLSADTTITTGDRLLGTWYVPRLDDHSMDAHTTMVTIPADIAPGTYYIGVIVDDQKEQAEEHESNNTRAFEITVTAPVPTVVTEDPLTDPDVDLSELDLTVASVEEIGSGLYNPGNVIMIDNTIENYGTATAYLVTVAFYASSDPEITQADYFLGECTIDIMAPGAMDNDVTLCTIPESIPEGFYFIGAIVDDTNTLTESDETNNTGYASSTIEIITTSP